MRTAFVIRWHRRLAWIAAVVLTVWAMSGALHPLMSWLSPRAAVFTPPKVEAMRPEGWAEPQRVLQSAGITEVQTVRYLMHQGAPVLQVTLPDVAGRRYFDAASGTPLMNADRERAIALARHYSGEQAPVLSVETQTRFERSYASINRYLPAWKVRFDTPDALTVYVDTGNGRLATMHNRTRLVLLYAFQIMHTLDFLEPVEALRLLTISFGVATLLAVSGLGMALLMVLKRPKAPKGARGWHRRLAWVAWLPLLCFGISGLLHLFVHSSLNAPLPQQTPPLAVDHIPALPKTEEGFTDALLVGTTWRVTLAGGKGVMLDAQGNATPEKDVLASRFPGANPKEEPTLVTRFGPEYGFAYKRLPVWRMVLENGGVVFFDPVDQVVAHQASTLKRAEAWSFSTLHKWQFLDALGMKQKDAMLLAAACFMLAFALIGIRLLLKKKA